MVLWRIATAPDELDGADTLMETSFSATTSTTASAGLHQRAFTSKPASPRISESAYEPTGPFLIKTHQPADTNKNTAWFLYPGVWTMYFVIVLLTWLLILSVLGCSTGTAWTLVNLTHFVVTFYLFHWKKGSPFAEDQGVYDKLTWWEQVDDGRQFTRTRKFLTAVPVILNGSSFRSSNGFNVNSGYLIAAYSMRHSEYSSSVLCLNTVVVFTLIIAKLPILHQVRLFGINADYPT